MVKSQNSAKKRLFVAINLPRGIRSDIFDLQKKILRKGSTSLDFVPRLNLHITLLFLGDQSDLNTKAIKMAVYFAVRSKHSFKIELNRIIVFRGDDGRIKLLAIEAFPTHELKSIRREINKRLVKSNIKFISKGRFIPHVTIARIKLNDSLSIKKVKSFMRGGFEKMVFVPDGVDVMESVQEKSDSRIYKSIYGVILRPPDVSKGWFNE